MTTSKPSGLISNKKIVPKNPSDLSDVPARTRNKNKTAFDNQKANLKIPIKTKKEIDLLIGITNNKFSYEVVQDMIDSYVANELNTDQQRAFKALTDL